MFKLGGVVVAKKTVHMRGSGDLFLIKNKEYIITDVRTGGISINSECGVDHGINFYTPGNDTDEFFYTKKQIRRIKIKQLKNDL